MVCNFPACQGDASMMDSMAWGMEQPEAFVSLQTKCCRGSEVASDDRLALHFAVETLNSQRSEEAQQNWEEAG